MSDEQKRLLDMQRKELEARGFSGEELRRLMEPLETFALDGE